MGDCNYWSPPGLNPGTSAIYNFVTDLQHGIHHEAIPVNYAVYTCILLTAGNTEELKVKINPTLDYMIDWFSVKGLVCNIEKTNINLPQAVVTMNLSKLYTKIK